MARKLIVADASRAQRNHSSFAPSGTPPVTLAGAFGNVPDQNGVALAWRSSLSFLRIDLCRLLLGVRIRGRCIVHFNSLDVSRLTLCDRHFHTTF